MRRPAWLRFLSRLVAGDPVRRTVARGSRRPSIEELESRCLLAAWSPIGPAPQSTIAGSVAVNFTGRVSALAVGQDNLGMPALFLGAASGGVWRTTNWDAATDQFSDTPTWTQVSGSVTLPDLTAIPPSGLVGTNNIGAIAVDPSNPKTIYVGTGEANYSMDSGPGAGILKSTDGGNSWVLISRGPGNAFVGQSFSKIIVTPSALYAAVVPAGGQQATSADGVYRSINGGVDWTRITTGVYVSSPVALPEMLAGLAA